MSRAEEMLEVIDLSENEQDEQTVVNYLTSRLEGRQFSSMDDALTWARQQMESLPLSNDIKRAFVRIPTRDMRTGLGYKLFTLTRDPQGPSPRTDISPSSIDALGAWIDRTRPSGGPSSHPSPQHNDTGQPTDYWTRDDLEDAQERGRLSRVDKAFYEILTEADWSYFHWESAQDARMWLNSLQGGSRVMYGVSVLRLQELLNLVDMLWEEYQIYDDHRHNQEQTRPGALPPRPTPSPIQRTAPLTMPVRNSHPLRDSFSAIAQDLLDKIFAGVDISARTIVANLDYQRLPDDERRIVLQAIIDYAEKLKQAAEDQLRRLT